jgi:hypothetical protein
MKEHLERNPSAHVESEEISAKYADFTNALDDEERLFHEMDEFLRSTADKREAEKIACDRFIPTIDRARKRTTDALRQWLNSLRK